MYRLISIICLLVFLTGSSMASPAPQSLQIASMDIAVSELPGSAANSLPVRAASTATRRAAFDFGRDALVTSSPLPMPRKPDAPSAQAADFLTFDGSFIKDLVRINWSLRPGASPLAFAVERRSQLDGRWSTVRYLHASERGNREGYSYYDRDGIDGVTYYRIRQVSANGASIPTPAISVMPHLVPNSFVIWQHRVDPFTRFGTLSFGLGSEMPVSVTMIDSYGRTVTSLLNEQLPSGHHIVPFSTSSLPAGVYTLRLESDGGVQTRRLAVL